MDNFCKSGIIRHQVRQDVEQDDHGRAGEEHAGEALRAPFPFPSDLHFNRITASAAIDAMRALLHPALVRTHLPGVLGLVGGYPVCVENGQICLDLAEHWREARAIAINGNSLRWDGIERIEADGTIVYH